MKKLIRKNVYRWHRITSLIVAVPILLWTLSGFLHPVMDAFKPDVKTQTLPLQKIDVTKINVSLSQALQQNGLDSIRNFRVVTINGTYYYQVQQGDQATLQYIRCSDGALLKNGDALYAENLAQQFLHGANKGKIKSLPEEACHTEEAKGVKQAAVKTVIAPAAVTEVKLLTRFDEEYKGSQRLLPVYKVSFDRGDDRRLYVETNADRLAYAVDRRNAWFSRFFGVTHSWSFLNGMGKFKSILLGSFAALCFLTSLMGFYIYSITSKKKASAKTNKGFSKSFHRMAGNVFLVTTLLYSFSGAWHAFKKVPVQKATPTYSAVFSSADLNIPFEQFNNHLGKEHVISNVSVVKINGQNYWQVYYLNADKKANKIYLNTNTLQPLQNGDLEYAAFLASRFSSKKEPGIQQVKPITAFNHEYSMMNKRLPVVQVTLNTNKSYFIETATGSLAATITPLDKAERFSFSNLHMHHYAEMLAGKERGKTLKNTILISSTLGLLLVACTGIFIYLKRKLL